MGKTLRRKSRNFRKSRKRPIRHKKHKKHSKRRSTHRVNRKMKGGKPCDRIGVGDGFVWFGDSTFIGSGNVVAYIDNDNDKVINLNNNAMIGQEKHDKLLPTLLKKPDNFSETGKAYFVGIPLDNLSYDLKSKITEDKYRDVNNATVELQKIITDHNKSILKYCKLFVDDLNKKKITVNTKLNNENFLKVRENKNYYSRTSERHCMFNVDGPNIAFELKGEPIIVVQLGYHNKTPKKDILPDTSLIPINLTDEQ